MADAIIDEVIQSNLFVAYAPICSFLYLKWCGREDLNLHDVAITSA